MQPEDKKRLREYLEDPTGEVPAELSSALGPEEKRDADRHRALDRNLGRVLGQLGEAVDRRGPSLSEKQFKENLLKAIQSSEAKDSGDELAYLRKVRNRELTRRFIDRPEYGIGAAAALFILAFLPFAFSQNESGTGTGAVALVETTDGLAEDSVEVPLGSAPVPQAVPAPAAKPSQPRQPAAREEKQVAMAAPAKKEQKTQAVAKTNADAPAESGGTAPAPKAEEQVALAPSFRARSAPAPDALIEESAAEKPAAAPAAPLDVKLRVRERVLTNKVKLARDKAAKLKALRDLEAFYKQHGQTAKRQNVQRQIDALK